MADHNAGHDQHDVTFGRMLNVVIVKQQA